MKNAPRILKRKMAQLNSSINRYLIPLMIALFLICAQIGFSYYLSFQSIFLTSILFITITSNIDKIEFCALRWGILVVLLLNILYRYWSSSFYGIAPDSFRGLFRTSLLLMVVFMPLIILWLSFCRRTHGELYEAICVSVLFIFLSLFLWSAIDPVLEVRFFLQNSNVAWNIKPFDLLYRASLDPAQSQFRADFFYSESSLFSIVTILCFAMFQKINRFSFGVGSLLIGSITVVLVFYSRSLLGIIILIPALILAIETPRRFLVGGVIFLLLGLFILIQSDSYLSSRFSNILVSNSSFDRFFVIFMLGADNLIFGTFEELNLRRGIHNGLLFLIHCFGIIGLLPIGLFLMKYFSRHGLRSTMLLSICMIALFSQSGSIISPLKIGLLIWLVSSFCIQDQQCELRTND